MAIISASGAAFHLNGIHPCPVRDLLATNNCDSNLPNFIHSLMVQCLSQSSSQKVYGLNRQVPEGKEQKKSWGRWRCHPTSAMGSNGRYLVGYIMGGDEAWKINSSCRGWKATRQWSLRDGWSCRHLP